MMRRNETEGSTDDELLARTADGDTDAFAVLIRRHQGTVTRVAFRLLNGDRDAAEDIGQEAFLRLYRNSARFEAKGMLLTYLLTITRNLCLDYLRQKRPTDALEQATEMASPVLSGEALALQNERAEAVRRAIRALPEEQRTVLVLSHYEGLSYDEIASVLGCPTGTVASRKHSAMASLRRSLGGKI